MNSAEESSATAAALRPQLDIFLPRQDTIKDIVPLASAMEVERFSGKLPIASLTVEIKDDNGISVFTTHSIYAGEDLVVGRGRDSSIVIPSEFVSLEHFRIYTIVYEDAQSEDFPPLVYCEDMESTNGTWVNEWLIGNKEIRWEPYLLNHGDNIVIKPRYSNAEPLLTFYFRQLSTRPISENGGLDTDEIQAFQNDFQVLPRKLGEGNFGTVHLARCLKDKKQLACKIVNLRVLKHNEKEHQKLTREVVVLSKLNHPNIISLRQAFHMENTMYIFTELACGGDLFSYVVSNGGHLPDHHAVIIIRQLALAIQYLHSKQITHRDIKPENVLVSNTQIGHRIMLTDFGAAKQWSVAERLKSVVGTPGYTAPEIYSRDRASSNTEYSKNNDMWSLGTVTLFVLAGEAASNFGADNFIKGPSDIEKIADQGFIGEYWEPLALKRSAKSFLKKLLRLDASKRMSADAAVRHRWFVRSPAFNQELIKLYERAISTWSHPTTSLQIIESKSSGFRKPSPPSQAPRQKRVSQPSSLYFNGVSPYFGLDRRISVRPAKRDRQRQRSQFLEKLRASGRSFVSSPGAKVTKNVANTGRKRSHETWSDFDTSIFYAPIR